MFPKTLLASSVLALAISHALAAGVKFAGVNIAGFDFGCVTDGTCKLSSVDGPVKSLSTDVGGVSDGPGQMSHFVKKDKLNIFRLPVAWQYLVNSKLSGTLDATAFGSYDKLMQACLVTGAYCIIDIHNYARWDGAVIGASGGPTNADFSDLWKQLATKYAAEEKVVMGLMNEPHEMKSQGLLNSWAGSVQAAVTAIRGAGATSQMILLPGDGYTGASTLVSGGSAAALAGVTNPDGSTTNLIFDVHQYLDSNGSGTTKSCVKTADVFNELLNWLKNSKRQAMLTEIGGGSSDQSCIKNICEVLDFLNTNSDQFLGYLGWSAGSFDTTYVLGLTPDGDKDVPLMEKCFAAKFGGGAGVSSPPTPVSSAAAGVASSSAVAAPAHSASLSLPAAGGVSAPATTSSAAPSQTSASSGSTSGPSLVLPNSNPQGSASSGSGPSLVLPNSNPQGTSSTPAPASSSSSSSSSSPPPSSGGYGQVKGQQQPGGDDYQQQDDCDAEWEDTPIVSVKRNGKTRLSYEREI